MAASPVRGPMTPTLKELPSVLSEELDPPQAARLMAMTMAIVSANNFFFLS